MSEKEILITILLASYNRLELLKECIRSVVEQDLIECEVLIVDDGSDNVTIEWLRGLKNGIKVIFQENKGVATARQVGLHEASGKYVLILDSDDLLVEGAISHWKKTLSASPEIDFFYCNNQELYPNGKVKKSDYVEFKDAHSFRNAIFRNPRIPYKHSGLLFKRDFAIEAGGYNKSLTSKVDIDLVLKFLKAEGQFGLIPEPLVSFRFHGNAVSRKKRVKDLNLWWNLIDKYGYSSFMNFYFKMARTSWELLKFLFEQFIFYTSSKKNVTK
ncbi:glycosyltransferase [Marinoscillum sp. MHG1-6]|uniref:glycosyltransferase n=1 Tax=Marinoscillum sp. MHG1-6 TaxID=2959627 RepID=UPI00215896E2|nr:glycosyltransferase [Marinoscillum sp. MHG1-6]